MKLLRHLIPAVALAALASSAQAAVTPIVVHIAGSTAYRSAVHNAIANLMEHTSGGVTTYGQAAYINTNSSGSGLNLSNCTYAVFSGTITGISTPVVIETYWSGSISGQNTLVNNPTNISWLSPSAIPGSGANAVPGAQTNFVTNYGLSPGVGGGAGITGSAGNPTSAQTDTAAVADFCLSDAFQGSGPFAGSSSKLTGVKANATTTTSGSSNGDGIGEEIGIIPFVWVKGAANTTDTDYNTWTDITNITSDQAKYLLAANFAPASFLTGNNADSGVYLLISGRDGDSGTRLDAFAESTFGIFSTSDQYTFALTTDGVSGDNAGSTISGYNDFTSSLTPGVVPSNNVGGYNSGGSLAKAMATKNQDSYFTANLGAGAYIISYLGVADADGLLSPNVGSAPTPPVTYIHGTDLTFNGVSLSNPSNHSDATYGVNEINNGSYSFWTYEHFFARPGTESVPSGYQIFPYSQTVPIAGKLVNQLETVDAKVAGYLTSQVTATRSVEGGVITP